MFCCSFSCRLYCDCPAFINEDGCKDYGDRSLFFIVMVVMIMKVVVLDVMKIEIVELVIVVTCRGDGGVGVGCKG